MTTFEDRPRPGDLQGPSLVRPSYPVFSNASLLNVRKKVIKIFYLSARSERAPKSEGISLSSPTGELCAILFV